jgi:hypothetical protein
MQVMERDGSVVPADVREAAGQQQLGTFLRVGIDRIRSVLYVWRARVAIHRSLTCEGKSVVGGLFPIVRDPCT